MIERLKFINQKIKENQKISFDADGVLIDSATPVVKAFNNKYGTSYKRTDLNDWHTLRDWAIKEGLPVKDASEENFRIWTDPQILSESLVMPGSLEIYRSLLEKFKEIPIITVRNLNLREVTFDWFERFLPEIPRNWINIRNSDEVKGNDFKIGKINDNKIDWHFDDSLEVTLLTVKNTTSNVFYIALSKTSDEVNNSKRITVIPNWEWSPELYN